MAAGTRVSEAFLRWGWLLPLTLPFMYTGRCDRVHGPDGEGGWWFATGFLSATEHRYATQPSLVS